jgi:hypothetical protein
MLILIAMAAVLAVAVRALWRAAAMAAADRRHDNESLSRHEQAMCCLAAGGWIALAVGIATALVDDTRLQAGFVALGLVGGLAWCRLAFGRHVLRLGLVIVNARMWSLGVRRGSGW